MRRSAMIRSATSLGTHLDAEQAPVFRGYYEKPEVPSGFSDRKAAESARRRQPRPGFLRAICPLKEGRQNPAKTCGTRCCERHGARYITITSVSGARSEPKNPKNRLRGESSRSDD